MAIHAVVTGASGFVGGFVARWLALRGLEVTAIARHPAPPLADCPSLRWLRADLCDPGALPQSFDAIVHCAAEIPARCPDPDQLYGRNFDASRTVFRRALEARAGTVVFLSSMSAYGKITSPIVTEETPSRDLDAYGRAKLDAESDLAELVARGLPSGLSIRLPGTVGRGSHHNFLSDVLAKVLSGATVQANHPDSLFNNVVYVGDLAAFIDAWLRNPGDGHSVINLAAVYALPIREVLSLMFAAAERPEKLAYGSDGKSPFLIDMERALKLGYKPASVRASVQAFVRDSIATVEQ
jgi:nucleoside-diphosphate-sugar epimerase